MWNTILVLVADYGVFWEYLLYFLLCISACYEEPCRFTWVQPEVYEKLGRFTWVLPEVYKTLQESPAWFTTDVRSLPSVLWKPCWIAQQAFWKTLMESCELWYPVGPSADIYETLQESPAWFMTDVRSLQAFCENPVGLPNRHFGRPCWSPMDYETLWNLLQTFIRSYRSPLHGLWQTSGVSKHFVKPC